MMPETPVDPFTPLMAGATMLNELYHVHVEAGFTEEQAFALVSIVFSLNVQWAMTKAAEDN